MFRLTILVSGMLAGPLVFGANPAPEEFFRTQMQLKPAQIALIRSGRAVVKVLPTSDPTEVFVFGAVYVHGKPAAYLEFMRDLARGGRPASGYLGSGEFRSPPELGDLASLQLDPGDINDLKKCRPGDCDVQLPAESMEAARDSIQWTAADMDQHVAALAKSGILRMLGAYQQDGDRALKAYRDRSDAVPVGEQFRSLLSNLALFPQQLPALNRYLLEYPRSRPPGVEDFFYWENVNFGLRPTIRVNHAVVYRSPGPDEVLAIAIKQIYAPHYFQTALDLSFCVPASDGYYLITIKGSRQSGLKGIKGGLIRNVAIPKTRESMERA